MERPSLLWNWNISIFKNYFTAKITLILMIKKLPLNFFGCWRVKYLHMTYFMFVKKRRSFHWFSRNSELEATWISLIGWPNKTSNIYCVYFESLVWKRHVAKYVMGMSGLDVSCGITVSVVGHSVCVQNFATLSVSLPMCYIICKSHTVLKGLENVSLVSF